MSQSGPVNIVWFRRDLRLNDNAALYHALRDGRPVLPLFIFDTNILGELEDKYDRRVHFIHNSLVAINNQLIKFGSSLIVKKGSPSAVWKNLLKDYTINKVFANHDYEPYAKNRDSEVEKLLQKQGIAFQTFKDQVIFEKEEVLKDDGKPYTIFTPYSRKWKSLLNDFQLKSYPVNKYFKHCINTEKADIPTLKEIGFRETDSIFPNSKLNEAVIKNYENTRNLPAINGTSQLSVHLRFGTISIRELARQVREINESFLNELIWREFFMMILWHYPQVVYNSFKMEYDNIHWRNNEKEFKLWCEGKTGFPIVDAGMRELNETGLMHNRVRMIVASFLTKDLLIDWRWGEAYFAKKLLDYELSSNNGNWQWAASTGCDAAPYFRIFNPSEQAKKFDPQLKYIRKWIPELDSLEYPTPIVDHKMARERALKAYKAGLAMRGK